MHAAAGTGFLAGRVALVTGAGSGIGAAIARALSNAGAAIAGLDLPGRAAPVMEEFAGKGGSALALEADVRLRAEVDAAVAHAEAVLGRVTILVNAAGISPYRAFLEADEALWDAGVDPTLLERCRARAEAIIGGRTTDDPDASSEADRAAVAFAEQYVIDPHGVTDAQAEELHRLFTPPQLAALTTALATFDALARVRTVLVSRSGTPASIDVSPS